MRDPRQMYAAIDADGNGQLDCVEVKRLCRLLGMKKISKRQVGQLMADIDEDGDGVITIDEFCLWWANNGGAQYTAAVPPGPGDPSWVEQKRRFEQNREHVENNRRARQEGGEDALLTRDFTGKLVSNGVSVDSPRALETRVDPADGKSYTLSEFKAEYGGTAEWDAAQNTCRSEDGSRSNPDGEFENFEVESPNGNVENPVYTGGAHGAVDNWNLLSHVASVHPHLAPSRRPAVEREQDMSTMSRHERHDALHHDALDTRIDAILAQSLGAQPPLAPPRPSIANTAASARAANKWGRAIQHAGEHGSVPGHVVASFDEGTCGFVGNINPDFGTHIVISALTKGGQAMRQGVCVGASIVAVNGLSLPPRTTVLAFEERVRNVGRPFDITFQNPGVYIPGAKAFSLYQGGQH